MCENPRSAWAVFRKTVVVIAYPLVSALITLPVLGTLAVYNYVGERNLWAACFTVVALVCCLVAWARVVEFWRAVRRLRTVRSMKLKDKLKLKPERLYRTLGKLLGGTRGRIRVYQLASEYALCPPAVTGWAESLARSMCQQRLTWMKWVWATLTPAKLHPK